MSEGAPATPAPATGHLSRVAAIESHCVRAWPARFVEETEDGWVLRATPGLAGRGRSNHALPPVRVLDRSEYDGALERVREFALRNGVECGVQISPTDLHAPLIAELEDRGWRLGGEVLVMAADTQAVVGGGVGLDGGFIELAVQDSATDDWVAAWAHCDRRSDIDEHLAHAFPQMAGLANFVHSGTRAVGISVELDGIVGLFCLAVDPALRRQGLGKALVRSMLAQHAAPLTEQAEAPSQQAAGLAQQAAGLAQQAEAPAQQAAGLAHQATPLTYLQVFSQNVAGVALYTSLGFQEIYRYRHAMAPDIDI